MSPVWACWPKCQKWLNFSANALLWPDSAAEHIRGSYLLWFLCDPVWLLHCALNRVNIMCLSGRNMCLLMSEWCYVIIYRQSNCADCKQSRKMYSSLLLPLYTQQWLSASPRCLCFKCRSMYSNSQS